MDNDKPMAPWKRELFLETEAMEETPEFQKGVIAGYHEAGTGLAQGKTLSQEEIRQWARGFAAGYSIRLLRAGTP